MGEIRDETSESSIDNERREALFAEYGEVCNIFRMLTDIRFRLLAFLPIASAAAVVAALVAAMNSDVQPAVGLAIGLALSLFGLVATIGLTTYNARNDQLYFELVSRAAAIERSLNLPDGAFANRPGTWQCIALPGIKWEIDHGKAVRTIYSASITLWLFGAVAFVFECCRRAYVASGLNESFSPEGSWTQMILVAASTLSVVAIPIIGTLWGGRQIRKQNEERQKKMGSLAREAMQVATELEAPDTTDLRMFVRTCAADKEFRRKCAVLALCAAKDNDKDKVMGRVEARADFYADRGTERLSYYVPLESKDLALAHLVGLLTDLSPLWIYDCGTNRKGDILIKDR